MDVAIRLVGRPSIKRGGQETRRLRGHKAWAVLAYIERSASPVSRQQLADLLFGEANDPLGALRWTLAELRRALGESTLLRGDPLSSLDDVSLDIDVGGIEQAWSMSCQLGGPCWEAMTARVLATQSARNGDLTAASTWLDEALHRCQSGTDQYQWVRATVLDSMIDLAIRHDDPERAVSLVNTLTELAARCEMRELVVRSHLHQARLGETTAWESARLLADDIDNPALQRELDHFQRSATP